RPAMFWATCGVTLSSRRAVMKPAVSKPLSPATVIRWQPGTSAAMAAAASRSAVPLASLTRLSTNKPCRFSIQRMAHRTELGLLASAFAIEPCLGVGDRGVGLVAALLAMKVTFAVAARPWRLAAAVLGPEALHGCPSLDQRAVDREML